MTTSTKGPFQSLVNKQNWLSHRNLIGHHKYLTSQNLPPYKICCPRQLLMLPVRKSALANANPEMCTVHLTLQTLKVFNRLIIQNSGQMVAKIYIICVNFSEVKMLVLYYSATKTWGDTKFAGLPHIQAELYEFEENYKFASEKAS